MSEIVIQQKKKKFYPEFFLPLFLWELFKKIDNLILFYLLRPLGHREMWFLTDQLNFQYAE